MAKLATIDMVRDVLGQIKGLATQKAEIDLSNVEALPTAVVEQLKGADGAQGPAGIAGAVGPQGPAGADGVDLGLMGSIEDFEGELI